MYKGTLSELETKLDRLNDEIRNARENGDNHKAQSLQYDKEDLICAIRDKKIGW